MSEVSVGGRVAAALTNKLVTTETTHIWSVELKYELVAEPRGGEAAEPLVLCERVRRGERRTMTDRAPLAAAVVPAHTAEVSLTWMLRQLRDDGGRNVPRFQIAREAATCATPRRNSDVDAALTHFASLSRWASGVAHYLSSVDSKLLGGDVARARAGARGAGAGVLVPVLPLLLPPPPGEGAPTLLGLGEVSALLEEERTALRRASDDLEQLHSADAEAGAPAPAGATATAAATRHRSRVFITTHEDSALTLMLRHTEAVATQLEDSLDFIESMLRAQLAAAIGKHVTPADFAEVRHH